MTWDDFQTVENLLDGEEAYLIHPITDATAGEITLITSKLLISLATSTLVIVNLMCSLTVLTEKFYGF